MKVVESRVRDAAREHQPGEKLERVLEYVRALRVEVVAREALVRHVGVPREQIAERVDDEERVLARGVEEGG